MYLPGFLISLNRLKIDASCKFSQAINFPLPHFFRDVLRGPSWQKHQKIRNLTKGGKSPSKDTEENTSWCSKNLSWLNRVLPCQGDESLWKEEQESQVGRQVSTLLPSLLPSHSLCAPLRGVCADSELGFSILLYSLLPPAGGISWLTHRV